MGDAIRVFHDANPR